MRTTYAITIITLLYYDYLIAEGKEHMEADLNIPLAIVT